MTVPCKASDYNAYVLKVISRSTFDLRVVLDVVNRLPGFARPTRAPFQREKDLYSFIDGFREQRAVRIPNVPRPRRRLPGKWRSIQ